MDKKCAPVRERREERDALAGRAQAAAQRLEREGERLELGDRRGVVHTQVVHREGLRELAAGRELLVEHSEHEGPERGDLLGGAVAVLRDGAILQERELPLRVPFGRDGVRLVEAALELVLVGREVERDEAQKHGCRSYRDGASHGESNCSAAAHENTIIGGMTSSKYCVPHTKKKRGPARSARGLERLLGAWLRRVARVFDVVALWLVCEPLGPHVHPDREGEERGGDDAVDDRDAGVQRAVLVAQHVRGIGDADESDGPRAGCVANTARPFDSLELIEEHRDEGVQEGEPTGKDGDGGDGCGHVDLRVEPD